MIEDTGFENKIYDRRLRMHYYDNCPPSRSGLDHYIFVAYRNNRKINQWYIGIGETPLSQLCLIDKNADIITGDTNFAYDKKKLLRFIKTNWNHLQEVWNNLDGLDYTKIIK